MSIHLRFLPLTFTTSAYLSFLRRTALQTILPVPLCGAFPRGESISFEFIRFCTIYTTASGFPCIASSPLVTPCLNWRSGFSFVPFSVRLVRTSPVPRRLLPVPFLEPDTSNGNSPINHAFSVLPLVSPVLPSIVADKSYFQSNWYYYLPSV